MLPSSKEQILIIDDDQDLCETFAHYLKDCGFSVAYALNGRDGLKTIEELAPDLLLLDIRMPGMNGLETVRQIIQRYPNLRVMVMTAFFDPDTAKQAIEYGACEFLSKPIKIEDLLQHYIEPLLSRR